MDQSNDTPHTVNSANSAIGALERGLALSIRHLDIVSNDLDRHSITVDRMQVVLSREGDLADLRRALALEQRACFKVRRQLVHAFLSTAVHLQFLGVCKNRPETPSFDDELAWKLQFDRIIEVVKEELSAADAAFTGIAEEERRFGLHR